MRKAIWRALEALAELALGLALTAAAGGALLLACTPQAHAAELWKWEHFGASPFAASREAAMAQKGAVLKSLGYPEAAQVALSKAMEQPGVEVNLVTGYRFLAQIGKGGEVHGLKEGGGIIAFQDEVGGKIRRAAVAERWQVTVDGVEYTLDRPEICQNFTRGVDKPIERNVVAAPSVGASTQQFGQKVQIETCPSVYWLKINVWPHEALSLPGVAETHAKEEAGKDEFGRLIHVSKRHGKQLRDALKTGKLKRSATPRLFQVSLIGTPEARGGDTSIAVEEVLGTVTVTGITELKFTRAQLDKWDAIRVVAVNGDVTSPPRNRRTGVKELRFFNHWPGTTLGEWDSNPDPDCIMNKHVIE